MHQAGGAADELVDAALEHGLEVLMEIAPGNLHEDAERHRLSELGRVDIRAHHRDLAVLNLVHGCPAQVLESGGVLAPELDLQVLLAHPLALEGRSVGDGDGDLRYLQLEPPHFHGFGYDLFKRDAGDDVLVGADAAGQDLRDGGIGDDREAEVDGARGRREFLVREQLLLGSVGVGAQGEDEGEDAVLVVEEDLTRRLEIARLDAAEGHGRARGEVEGVDGCAHVPSVRDKVGVPTHFHALLGQLLRHGVAVAAPGHENQDALLLELARQSHGLLVGGQAAHAGGEPRHAAVHQLDPLIAQDGIVREAEERGLRLVRGIEILEDLDDLLADQRDDTRVEGRSQVGKPEALRGNFGQKGTHLGERLPAVLQRLDLPPEEGEDERQVVGGVGKADARVRAVLLDGLTQVGFGL